MNNEKGDEEIYPVILFDGVCNLCNNFVDFILRVDKRGVFKLGALQSKSGKELLLLHGIHEPGLSSVVVLFPERHFKQSRAVLEIFRRLPFPWPFFYIGILLPSFIRDWLYQQIALRRYNWFGRRTACRLPEPHERTRFV
jgi:predicted DCC family thiol-disulfide oxidoreductase YuxK